MTCATIRVSKKLSRRQLSQKTRLNVLQLGSSELPRLGLVSFDLACSCRVPLSTLTRAKRTAHNDNESNRMSDEQAVCVRCFRDWAVHGRKCFRAKPGPRGERFTASRARWRNGGNGACHCHRIEHSHCGRSRPEPWGYLSHRRH